MSIESFNKGMKHMLDQGAWRALNERTRLKIAITEILEAKGHGAVEIKEAIEGVCNCDFSKLKDLFEIHTGD